MAIEQVKEITEGLILRYSSGEDIDSAISRCLAYAAGRKVHWTVIPFCERKQRESLHDRPGYVGVFLADADASPTFGAADARELMMQELTA